MQAITNISKNTERKKLKNFIPMVIAFYGCMVLLSLFQNLRLYFDGVLDSFLNKSFFLLLLHHTGFSALVAFILAFVFNFSETKKVDLGYIISKFVLVFLVFIEAVLIEHYVQNYDALGFGMFDMAKVISKGHTLTPFLISVVLVLVFYHFSLKWTRSLYKVVSRMYPFTIILFSLFLATLNTDKNPINENKTQHYLQSTLAYVFDFNKYEGAQEYPLLSEFNPQKGLGEYLTLTETKPNIVVLIIDGLGSDFIGQNVKYKGFTPYLQSLSKESIYWENHLSNTGEGFASLPTIMGSLPFGKKGFTNISDYLNRQTLYSVLKENSYITSFNYGGNSGLNGLDRFLDEERVDEVLDKKGFGPQFILQEEDAAGITLGYPDQELFRKWVSLDKSMDKPRLDVFLNLSTKAPYLIPEQEAYLAKVDQISSNSQMNKRTKRIINRNKEVFASLIYTDEAVKQFINALKKSSTFKNTIVLITGSHNVKDLPQNNNIDRYRVPLMVYSPLVKEPKRISAMVSHADITPTIVSMLSNKYDIKVPKQTAWLGDNLIHKSIFKSKKQIPLFRNRNNICDYIDEDLFVTNTSVYQLNKELAYIDTSNELKVDGALENFKNFKAINKYVTKQNKIVPQAMAIYPKIANEFSKVELVWIQSVFNGSDFDNAYGTARDLAINKEWDRSLLLARYILSEIPRHADTEVLIGRIYAWQKEYPKAIDTLREVIRKYPNYTDAYAAILDAYYWSGNSDQANAVFKLINRNGIESKGIETKVKRAKEQIKAKALDKPLSKTEAQANLVVTNK